MSDRPGRRFSSGLRRMIAAGGAALLVLGLAGGASPAFAHASTRGLAARGSPGPSWRDTQRQPLCTVVGSRRRATRHRRGAGGRAAAAPARA